MVRSDVSTLLALVGVLFIGVHAAPLEINLKAKTEELERRLDTYLTREEFQAGIKSMEHLVHQLVATDNELLNHWRNTVENVNQIQLMVQDMETKNPSSAIYFYDRDGKILVRTDQIERIRVLEKTMERLESLLERTVN